MAEAAGCDGGGSGAGDRGTGVVKCGRTRAGGGGVEPNPAGVSATADGCGIVRGAGGADTASGGGGVRAAAVELPGTEWAGQPAGSLFKEYGSGAGSSGGSVRRAKSGDGGGAAGGAEGGRSLCAAGSGVSG